MPTLVIGDPCLIPKNPTSIYRFVVSQMSGDADAYNEEHINVTTIEEALATVEMLDCLESLSNGYHNNTKAMCEGVRSTLTEDAIKKAVGDGYLEDYISDVVGYDVTSDGLASLDGYTIYWFDDRGVQYNVSVVR